MDRAGPQQTAGDRNKPWLTRHTIVVRSKHCLLNNVLLNKYDMPPGGFRFFLVDQVVVNNLRFDKRYVTYFSLGHFASFYNF